MNGKSNEEILQADEKKTRKIEDSQFKKFLKLPGRNGPVPPPGK